MSSKLLLVDGNSLTYRAFFALPQDMSTASGQLTNAVFGFTSMFILVLKEQRPDEVLVAFDRPEPTFRHEADETYKANREAAPDSCASRWAWCARCSSALGVATCELAGWEADDLIATATEQAVGRGDDVVIVTGDRDAYQLVKDPHVKVLYNRRGVSDYALYDEAGIVERTGVTPAQYPEYAALRGDPSDNLPGVPGVGEKTAAKLIVTYGGLDGIFAHVDEQTPKLRAVARRARGAHPQEPRGDDPAPRRPRRAARDAGDAAEHGRGAAAVRLPRVPHVRRAAGRGARAGRPSSLRDDEREQLVAEVDRRWRRRPTSAQLLGSLDAARRRRLVGGRAGAHARSVASRSSPTRRPRPCRGSPPTTSTTAPSRAALVGGRGPRPRRQGADARRCSRAASSSAASRWTRRSPPTCSTRPRRATSWRTSSSATRASPRRPTSRRPRASSTSTAPPADPPTVAGREALAVHHLVEPITAQLAEQGMADLYATIENPLVRVLARMEHAGVAVDVADLRQLHERLTADVQRLGLELREVVGRDDLNINSPIQLREILLRRPAGRPRPDAGQEDEDRRLHRRRDAGEAARPVAGVHRPAAAVPRGGEAARHLRRGAARRGRRRTVASTPRSTRPSPAPGGSARTARTCTTSRCGATRAGCSAGRSSPRPAASCSSPTTTRSSCAASPTSPPTPG